MCLMDQGRPCVLIPSRQQQAVHSPISCHPTEGYSPCPHPVPRPCNNSIISTSLHPSFTTNSAMYCMGGNIVNVYRTFRVMIWCGLLNIWTRYVAVLLFLNLHLSRGRRSIVSTLLVPLSGSVYENSEADAAPGGCSQHRTGFRLTF